MALVADQVIVELQAKIGQYQANVAAAENKFTRAMKSIENAGTRASSGIAASFAKIGIGFASAQLIRGATQLIDASIKVTNSLKVAGLAGEDLKAVYDDLFASAQRNATPINDLATLYSRAATNAKELGADQERLAKFTDVVAMSLKAGGGSAQEASGALLQLGQALGSSRIQAEEYNSLIDGARPLLQAVAAGIKETGGSVAGLTKLVKDGKISNKAFFDGAIAGSSVLETQLAGSELTISSAFVRLQNVLIDVGGKFNETSGAGKRFAEFLGTLGEAITEFANSPSFEKGLNDLGDEISKTFERDLADIKRIGDAIEFLRSKFDTFGSAVSDADIELDDAYQSMANLATNTKGMFGDVDAAFQDLVQQLINGRGTAESAKEAIIALGEVNPEFSALQSKILAAIENFIRLRDAANAARAAAGQTDNVGTSSDFGDFSKTFNPPKPVKQITLADYPVTGGGAGGSSKSPKAKFDDALQKIKDQTAALGLEQQALGELTYESEKAKTAQDLLNEARDAGIKITPQVKASIDEVAAGYADAAQSLESAKKFQDAFTEGATSALTGFISDLREGKSAAEALGNVFNNLADQLLNIAAQGLVQAAFGGLFGGAGGGVGGFFSSLFGLRGHALGTANTGGSRGAVAGIVHGQEAVIPLPSGGKVPVVVSGGGNSAPASVEVHVVAGEYFDARVGNVSQGVAAKVASRGIQQYDQALPGRQADKNARFSNGS